MTATIHWQLEHYHGRRTVDPQSKKQPWIWAVGPRQNMESADTESEIEQHSTFGWSRQDVKQSEDILLIL